MIPWLCAQSSGLVTITVSGDDWTRVRSDWLRPSRDPVWFPIATIGGDMETKEIDNVANLSTLHLGFTSHL